MFVNLAWAGSAEAGWRGGGAPGPVPPVRGADQRGDGAEAQAGLLTHYICTGHFYNLFIYIKEVNLIYSRIFRLCFEKKTLKFNLFPDFVFVGQ